MATLVVICHPRPDSLTRAAAQRVLAGLEKSGEPVRVLDLEAEDFEACLSLEEKLHYDAGPDSRPDLVEHFEALQWASRVVFVYPTWFSGQPARLKGWFDRVCIPGLAFDVPAGSNRVKRRLTNIRRLEVVTSHGSSCWINLLQAHSGQRLIFRSLRAVCHPLCTVRRTTIYDLDRISDADVRAWLDHVEERFTR